MIVRNSKLYTTGYVLVKIDIYFAINDWTFSFHDLNYVPNYVYPFS